MVDQQIISLEIGNVPYPIVSANDSTAITSQYRHFQGYRGITITQSTEGPFYNASVYFETEADAWKALGLQYIQLGGRRYHVELCVRQDGESGPPRKRIKKEVTECRICLDEINEEHVEYVRPCRKCQGIWCYGCIEKHIKLALKDHERMPARCHEVLHFDVGKAILDTATYELYKQRFEEFVTPNPLYCPVPTCSAFLPPRIQLPENDKVKCPSCTVSICLKCRQQTTGKHVCQEDAVKEELSKLFEYKSCPKCGTLVMKMFGCPHIRCTCGGHWCWDCCRPIFECFRHPCASALEDGATQRDDSEDEDMAEGEETAEVSEDGVNSALGATSQLSHGAEPANPVEELAEAERAILRAADASIELPLGAEDVSIERPALRENHIANEIARHNQSVIENSHTGNMWDPAISRSGPILHDMAAPQTTIPQLSFPPVQVPESDPPSAAEPDGQASGDSAGNSTDHQTERVNLDDPWAYDWEATGEDFGEEPPDEPWDIWGCKHKFRELTTDKLPDKWMAGFNHSAEELEVGCMSCFQNTPIPKPAGCAEMETQNKLATRAMTFDCKDCSGVFCLLCKAKTETERKKQRARKK